ncbi:MAG TPA: hypothetical protein VI796_00715 [Candidatus Thermoplasmatota archaeon]|nr:hypothetical protein [Candidatus Thermoplasmatota archaeon]
MTGMRPGHAALDLWSLVHLGAGVALGLLGTVWWLAFLLLVAFEALEGILRRVKRHGGGGLFEYESWPNVLADIAIGMVGWYGGLWFRAGPGWP